MNYSFYLKVFLKRENKIVKSLKKWYNNRNGAKEHKIITLRGI